MYSTFFVLTIAILAVIAPSDGQKKAPKVITEPQEIVGEAGTSVTLPCEIKNPGRRSVFWFKGDDPEGRELIMQMRALRGKYRVPKQYKQIVSLGKLATDGSNLVIKDLAATDADTYTCSIAVADQAVTHTLTVVGGEPAPPPPTPAPIHLTATPDNGQLTVTEGLPASLTCVPDSEIPATVSWFREGDSKVLGVGHNFNIFETSLTDTGRYVCTADNGVAEPVSSTFDIVVEVHVPAPSPIYLTASPDDGQVPVGEGLPASLSCIATSERPTTVTWYREGYPDALAVGSTFNLFKTSRSDAGRYICKAENGQAEPLTYAFDISVHYVDVYTQEMDVLVSGPAQTATISCTVTGFPEPEMEWYTKDGPISGYRHTISSEGNVHSLEIVKMTSGDLGDYECYGYNDRSNARSTVTVTAAPGPVTILDVYQTGENWYTVEWEVHCLAPIRFYYVSVTETSTGEVSRKNVEGSSVPYDGHTLYRSNSAFDFIPGRSYEIMVQAIAEEYQPGPEMEPAYFYTVPIEDAAEGEAAVTAKLVSEKVSEKDVWKWWKVTMTLASRLPQVVRLMQDD